MTATARAARGEKRPVSVFVVSHSHLDREWRTTFEGFRARLVDFVDAALDLIAEDPAYRFHLDGQARLLEDYLQVRPHRRDELSAACHRRQLGIGPWYIQSDMLMTSAEGLVRNLLEGRRVASELGPVSSVGYVPDSFGHPAQLPHILAGFGIESFVYSRGSGNEIDDLPLQYRWVAESGAEVLACNLAGGYFAGASLPGETAHDTATRWATLVDRLSARSVDGRALVMNGGDHAPPDPQARHAAEALAARTTAPVLRVLLDDFVADPPGELPAYSGELIGARQMFVVPGVWSTRLPLKRKYRSCEAELTGWTEPWSAMLALLGGPDERAALRHAWRELIPLQAHDTLCGNSLDAVHQSMATKLEAISDLAGETTRRCLDRIAGTGPIRETPWGDTFDVAVFNPSPHARTDVVRVPLDPEPAARFAEERDIRLHPLLLATLNPRRFTVEGRSARLVAGDPRRRFLLLPGQPTWDLEFVAADVPAFGWKRYTIRADQPIRGEDLDEVVDDGRQIAVGDLAVTASSDGTLSVRAGVHSWDGLAGIDDRGDRGDSYDFDPIGVDAWPVRVTDIEISRRRHCNGIQVLRVDRTIETPSGLDANRTAGTATTTRSRISVEARLAPGVHRVDLHVTVDNHGSDHRLRLRFPTGRSTSELTAAATYSIARRTPGPPAHQGWCQAPPTTFPHHGWISANELTVIAPGLPEGEVDEDGCIAVTLLRSVGWLSRGDLATRPGPAGPAIPTPDAQCTGDRVLDTWLAVMPAGDPRAATDAELGLRAALTGPQPLLRDDTPLLAVEPHSVLLSALKLADDGDGIVLRLFNPTGGPLVAAVRAARSFTAEPVRLDETTPHDASIDRAHDGTLRATIDARSTLTLRLRPTGAT